MRHLLLRLIRLYRRITSGKYGWSGNYKTWNEAKEECTGYDSDIILAKVKAATLKVKKGEAVYERDAMLHDKIDYSWPLLSNLLWIASKNQNRLSVIDFGGSLGTSYFQNRKYLQHLSGLTWSVTEQKNYVVAGRSEIGDEHLHFYYNSEEAIADNGMPNVLLTSCVLPYLENPYDILQSILSIKAPFFIIDNTYFNPRNGDRLTVQNVPPVYYEASYPAWFLDYEKVKAIISKEYEIMEEYTNSQFLYLDGEKVDYRGIIAKRR